LNASRRSSATASSGGVHMPPSIGASEVPPQTTGHTRVAPQAPHSSGERDMSRPGRRIRPSIRAGAPQAQQASPVGHHQTAYGQLEPVIRSSRIQGGRSGRRATLQRRLSSASIARYRFIRWGLLALGAAIVLVRRRWRLTAARWVNPICPAFPFASTGWRSA
jgi:hypothetical protein